MDDTTVLEKPSTLLKLKPRTTTTLTEEEKVNMEAAKFEIWLRNQLALWRR